MMTFMNEKKTQTVEATQLSWHTLKIVTELLVPVGGEYKLVPLLESTLAVPITASVLHFTSLLSSLVSLGYKHDKILFCLTNVPIYYGEPPCQLRNRLP